MSVLHRNEDDASEVLQEHAEISAADQDFLDVLPVGVFVIDRESRITRFNRAAGDLLAVDPAGTIGQHCHDVMRCKFCGPTCATCAARDAGKLQTGFPTAVLTGNGQKRNLLIDAVPVSDGEIAVVMRDVTDSERLRRALKERWVFHGLVCVASPTKEIVDRIRDVAPYNSTVLILGESGTGKELVARAIHAESERSDRPFVAVNCSAYSENLLESELFGHVRGSFTGAERDRQGRFELADGGTVLLDEIGEITPKIQVKLLRVLQEREIERVGENRARPVDIRVVAATNRDLQQRVREGHFREDLYYRLNVFTLALPPLRDRTEDIPALADHFLGLLGERTGKRVSGFNDDVLAALMRYPWPGNVRELENVVESAVVRARGEVITSLDLPDTFLHNGGGPTMRPEERLRAALSKTAGCVTRAARLLGVHRTTLWRQMREMGLRREDFQVG